MFCLFVAVMLLAGCKLTTPQAPTDRVVKTCEHEANSVAAPATADRPNFRVSCNVSLGGNETVSKRLIFEGDAGSGVTFDCNGAVIDITQNQFVSNSTDIIEIKSLKRVDEMQNITWDRPRDIMLRNCKVIGAIRIYGMEKNSNHEDIRALSRTEGYVSEIRARAPTRITLDRVEIEGLGRTPLYLATGVSYVTVVNSTITGVATSVGVYLESESHHNTFRNNRFSVTSRAWDGLRRREEIAIDAAFVEKHLGELARSMDVSRYVL